MGMRSTGFIKSHPEALPLESPLAEVSRSDLLGIDQAVISFSGGIWVPVVLLASR
jgi:hypothetical protein